MSRISKKELEEALEEVHLHVLPTEEELEDEYFEALEQEELREIAEEE